ncbi:MAG: tagaturonate reductase [bacterium]|jgi:tagaturonate reductase|nr:tagaturonate reductase [Chitinophagaceae bacterium]
MRLQEELLHKYDHPEVSLPAPDALQLSEKVIMFGTGVLLRGLPAHFIEIANRRGVFNGRIVMVKSTDGGDATPFIHQNGLFTHLIQGYRHGEKVEEAFVNASISRVLSARTEWESIKALARNQAISVIISNTTESGIVLVPEDSIHAEPPVSFPGKLLALLHERYVHFKGDPERGWVILPTELIPDNGRKLLEILRTLARLNGLDQAFIDWVESANPCCNTLVDRIVPGKPPKDRLRALEEKFGYTDDLMIMSEPYALWAIETSHPKVSATLTFAEVNPEIHIRPDISVQRELKLRLLNGTHTFVCGPAVLAGFQTVDAAMENPVFGTYVRQLMIEDIIPAFRHPDISPEDAEAYASSVIDRFRNPQIGHRWLSITVNYSRKLQMRNLPLIHPALDRQGMIPERMSFALAAYLRFMKVSIGPDNKWRGSIDGFEYEVQDEFSAFYADLWVSHRDMTTLVQNAFNNTDLWGADMGTAAAIIGSVTGQLESILELGTLQAIARLSAH